MSGAAKPSSITPRTDAAERFFFEPGRPPVGFVDSFVARTLEVELTRALEQLAQLGGQPLPPLDARTQALLQSARRPKREVLGRIDVKASKAVPGAPASEVQVSLLVAALADASAGTVHTYADGELLYRVGEQAEHSFLLVSGQVRISERKDQGPDCTLSEGQVLAEQALFDADLHAETAVAQGSVQAVLVQSESLRQRLGADISILPYALMGLAVQQRMFREIARQAAGEGISGFSFLGERAFTGPELQRQIFDARNPANADRPAVHPLMCLQMQASDHLPVRIIRKGESLGRPGEEHSGLAVMVVSGKARAQWREHSVELGQGSLIGLAEGLTGKPYLWEFTAEQDINARVIPIERALQQFERTDPILRQWAGHCCAAILMRQQESLV